MAYAYTFLFSFYLKIHIATALPEVVRIYIWFKYSTEMQIVNTKFDSVGFDSDKENSTILWKRISFRSNWQLITTIHQKCTEKATSWRFLAISNQMNDIYCTSFTVNLMYRMTVHIVQCILLLKFYTVSKHPANSTIDAHSFATLLNFNSPLRPQSHEINTSFACGFTPVRMSNSIFTSYFIHIMRYFMQFSN